MKVVGAAHHLVLAEEAGPLALPGLITVFLALVLIELCQPRTWRFGREAKRGGGDGGERTSSSSSSLRLLGGGDGGALSLSMLYFCTTERRSLAW
jgi:hypothetical protein